MLMKLQLVGERRTKSCAFSNIRHISPLLIQKEVGEKKKENFLMDMSLRCCKMNTNGYYEIKNRIQVMPQDLSGSELGISWTAIIRRFP